MKILLIENYYYPYISGITESTKLLAENIANIKDFEVAVLCSNHDNLPKEEIINKVKVYRAPIVMKISKGTVSPAYIMMAKKLAKEYDVVHFHLPMLEAGILASLINPKKIVITYHCDINLRPSMLNNFIVKVMDLSHKRALKRANKIVFSSIDYAKSTRFCSKFLDKAREIAPLHKSIKKVNCKVKPHSIGFCGRIVEEKGIDVLLKAFKIVKETIPDAELRIAGDYKNVAGGSIYPELMEYVKENKIKDVNFLGKIPENDLGKFYSQLGVFTLPSTNSLEAYGLVQLEAMICGTPVVASDLPGVRTIVKNTKMGLIAKRKDERDLANKLIKVLNNREKYIVKKEAIDKKYSNDIVSNLYIGVYKEANEEANRKDN